MKPFVRKSLDRFAPLIAAILVFIYVYALAMPYPPAMNKTRNGLLSLPGAYVVLVFIVPGVIALCALFFLAENRFGRLSVIPTIGAGFGPYVGHRLNPGALFHAQDIGAAVLSAFFTYLFATLIRFLLQRSATRESKADRSPAVAARSPLDHQR